MSDYTLALNATTIVGQSGSGKSTFAFRYLLNAPAACRFIFDDQGRAATRLNMRPAFTARELEEAVPSRWVIFNPSRMFPSDYAAAFRFFCEWLFNVSKRGPGKKLVLADEIWQWQDNWQIPKELAMVVLAGREENIEFVCATHRPHRINSAITGQSTELVCFRLDEPKALKCVQELGASRQEVQALPPGAFISWNRISKGRLAGRVF